jgi:hypothetical protein
MSNPLEDPHFKSAYKKFSSGNEGEFDLKYLPRLAGINLQLNFHFPTLKDLLAKLGSGIAEIRLLLIPQLLLLNLPICHKSLVMEKAM